jgi:hypothetical protein
VMTTSSRERSGRKAIGRNCGQEPTGLGVLRSLTVANPGRCLIGLLLIGCWHSAPTAPARSDSGSGGAATRGATGGKGGLGLDGATERVDAHSRDSADSASIDRGDADAALPPRPPGCDTPGSLVTRTIFSDDFESYPVGPFENDIGSPWVRASMGRDVEISTAAASSGAQSLLIQSFTTKTETDYAPLPIDALPPHLSFRFTALLDGYIVYEDFVTVGLAVVRSKYDIAPVLAFKMSGHDLSLLASQEGGASQIIFQELDYGDPPRANVVQVDLDLCAWTADVSVGVPTSPLAPRAHVGITPFTAVAAIFASGGVNQAYIDAVSVDVATP